MSQVKELIMITPSILKTRVIKKLPQCLAREKVEAKAKETWMVAGDGYRDGIGCYVEKAKLSRHNGALQILDRRLVIIADESRRAVGTGRTLWCHK